MTDETPIPQPSTPPPDLTTPAQAIVSTNTQKQRSSHKGLWIVLILVVLLAAGAAYFWYLPSKAASDYEAKIKLQYATQTNAMNNVYNDFKKPVFASDDTKPEDDAKEFTATTGDIVAAQTATTVLTTNNTLKLLPGANVFKVADKALKHQQALTVYATKSKTFLTNFTNTIDYMKAFEDLFVKDEQGITTNLELITKATSPADLLSAMQKSQTAISATLTSLKKLSPTADVKKIHDQVVAALDQISAGLGTAIKGIDNQSESQIESGARLIQTGGDNLVKLSESGFADEFQTSSELAKQIAELKALKPLD